MWFVMALVGCAASMHPSMSKIEEKVSHTVLDNSWRYWISTLGNGPTSAPYLTVGSLCCKFLKLAENQENNGNLTEISNIINSIADNIKSQNYDIFCLQEVNDSHAREIKRRLEYLGLQYDYDISLNSQFPGKYKSFVTFYNARLFKIKGSSITCVNYNDPFYMQLMALKDKYADRRPPTDDMSLITPFYRISDNRDEFVIINFVNTEINPEGRRMQRPLDTRGSHYSLKRLIYTIEKKFKKNGSVPKVVIAGNFNIGLIGLSKVNMILGQSRYTFIEDIEKNKEYGLVEDIDKDPVHGEISRNDNAPPIRKLRYLRVDRGRSNGNKVPYTELGTAHNRESYISYRSKSCYMYHSTNLLCRYVLGFNHKDLELGLDRLLTISIPIAAKFYLNKNEEGSDDSLEVYNDLEEGSGPRDFVDKGCLIQ